MNEAEARCFLGTVLGHEKATREIDDAAVEKALGNDAHATAQYAEASTAASSTVASQAAAKNPSSASAKAAATFGKATGIHPHELLTFFGKPSEVLGEDVVKPVVDILLHHKQRYPTGNYAAYKAEVIPQLTAYRDSIAGNYTGAMRNYLNDWVQSEARGLSIYGRKAFESSVKNPIGKAADNVVSNLITQNPLIALYNIFELVPKAQAYAISELGPVKSQQAILKAFGDFMHASGGKFWARIPELESKGVYSSHELSPFEAKLQQKFGVSNLIDVTENPLRGVSYFLGEAMQPGKGLHAVENIAFTYRPGNTPAMLWNREGAATVHLMRYSIESMKLYGGLVKNLANPDKAANAAFALAAFHLVNAMQSGVSSSVPLPIYTALPQETKDYLDQISKQTPLFNLAGKVAGIDLSKQNQPLGGVAFGLGQQLLTQNLGQGVNTGLKGVKEVASGDAEKGVMDLLQGAFTTAQVAQIPGVNFTTLRLLKAARKSYENNDLTGPGLVDSTLDTFHLKPKE